MRLDIDVHTDANGVATVTVAGSIDLESKAALRTAGQSAMDGAGVTTLVLDLAGVQFMDSTGVGTLVELSSYAEERGITFQICDPAPRVERVLTSTGRSCAARAADPRLIPG
jgi:anti-sigma B factor antagonist